MTIWVDYPYLEFLLPMLLRQVVGTVGSWSWGDPPPNFTAGAAKLEILSAVSVQNSNSLMLVVLEKCLGRPLLQNLVLKKCSVDFFCKIARVLMQLLPDSSATGTQQKPNNTRHRLCWVSPMTTLSRQPFWRQTTLCIFFRILGKAFAKYRNVSRQKKN